MSIDNESIICFFLFFFQLDTISTFWEDEPQLRKFFQWIVCRELCRAFSWLMINKREFGYQEKYHTTSTSRPGIHNKTSWASHRDQTCKHLPHNWFLLHSLLPTCCLQLPVLCSSWLLLLDGINMPPPSCCFGKDIYYSNKNQNKKVILNFICLSLMTW